MDHRFHHRWRALRRAIHTRTRRARVVVHRSPAGACRRAGGYPGMRLPGGRPYDAAGEGLSAGSDSCCRRSPGEFVEDPVGFRNAGVPQPDAGPRRFRRTRRTDSAHLRRDLLRGLALSSARPGRVPAPGLRSLPRALALDGLLRGGRSGEARGRFPRSPAPGRHVASPECGADRVLPADAGQPGRHAVGGRLQERRTRQERNDRQWQRAGHPALGDALSGRNFLPTAQPFARAAKAGRLRD